MTAEKTRSVTPKTTRTAWGSDKQAHGGGNQMGTDILCKVFTGQGCKKGSNKTVCIFFNLSF